MSQITSYIGSGGGGGGPILTLTGNNPVAVPPDGAGNINIPGGLVAGTTTLTNTGNALAHTLTMTVSYDAIEGTYFGSGAGNAGVTGVQNTAVGFNAGNLLTTGDRNSFFGVSAGQFDQTGRRNTGIGNIALSNLEALGAPGNSNTAVGAGALGLLFSGSENIALGDSAGSNYNAAESSNIMIGNVGTALENNTIRLGTLGSGLGQQNQTFLVGDLFYNDIQAGFTGTTWVTKQAGAHTVGAVVTPIFTITPPNNGTSVLIKAYVNAYNTVSDDAYIAEVFWLGRLNNVGVMQDIGGSIQEFQDILGVTVAISAAGASISLQVEGDAGHTWNWVTTYHYMFIQTNA